jgi:hypothetical protein
MQLAPVGLLLSFPGLGKQNSRVVLVTQEKEIQHDCQFNAYHNRYGRVIVVGLPDRNGRRTMLRRSGDGLLSAGRLHGVLTGSRSNRQYGLVSRLLPRPDSHTVVRFAVDVCRRVSVDVCSVVSVTIRGIVSIELRFVVCSGVHVVIFRRLRN